MASTQKSTGGTRKSTANRSPNGIRVEVGVGHALGEGAIEWTGDDGAVRVGEENPRPSAQKSSRNGAKRSQNGTAKRGTASRNGSARSGRPARGRRPTSRRARPML